MSNKTTFSNGQHNSYEFNSDGTHTHTWYNTQTGLMGYHGENTSADDKKWSGQRANETMTRGDRTKGVKN